MSRYAGLRIRRRDMTMNTTRREMPLLTGLVAAVGGGMLLSIVLSWVVERWPVLALW